jgi:hypothetical protein
MNTRRLFAFVLSALVLGITVLALLGVWNVIDWIYIQKYFWKSIQSLLLILISSVVIYLIQTLVGGEDRSDRRTTN